MSHGTPAAIKQGVHAWFQGSNQHLVALLLIVIINVITFKGHYAGDFAFPWDFLGGYHAQAFGWFDKGSIVSPPGWLPWSDMGFPSSMALQSGAWYLPLAVLDALGIPYTIRVAVAVQCLHVAFGAAGVYALSRRLGLGFTTALIAGLAFHASATFYSNQQHPDIVRATAMLPWMLFFLHPGTLATRWGALAGGVLLSQLLIAGYPGNVVAAAYACAAWLFLAMQSMGAGQRRQYILGSAVVVILGVSISMVKWWPVVMNLGAVGFERWEPRPIEAPFLATLLFSYDNNFLPSDVTMRSLWLPLVILWGWIFFKPVRLIERAALALVALGLFMGMLVPHFDSLTRILPGMTASRWLISDWRPVLQLGLILGGAAGWQTLFGSRWGRNGLHMRLALGAVVTLSAIYVGRGLGYGKGELVWVGAAALALLFASRLAASLREDVPAVRSFSSTARPVVCVLLVLGCALQGVVYNRWQAKAWLMPWSEDAEASLYGRDILQWKASQHDGYARRPARMLVGEVSDPQAALAVRTSESYNQCWYGRTFCVLGYNNIRLSIPHKRFAETLAGPDGQALLAFASRAQQLWLVDDSSNAPPVRNGEESSSVIGSGASGVGINFISYGADRVVYDVQTPSAPATFIENEIWWKGWDYKYCNASGCSSWTPTKEGFASLRSWSVPAGNWQVALRFKDASSHSAIALALAGLLLALLWLAAIIKWPSLLPRGKSA